MKVKKKIEKLSVHMIGLNRTILMNRVSVAFHLNDGHVEQIFIDF